MSSRSAICKITVSTTFVTQNIDSGTFFDEVIQGSLKYTKPPKCSFDYRFKEGEFMDHQIRWEGIGQTQRDDKKDKKRFNFKECEKIFFQIQSQECWIHFEKIPESSKNTWEKESKDKPHRFEFYFDKKQEKHIKKKSEVCLVDEKSTIRALKDEIDEKIQLVEEAKSDKKSQETSLDWLRLQNTLYDMNAFDVKVGSSLQRDEFFITDNLSMLIKFYNFLLFIFTLLTDSKENRRFKHFKQEINLQYCALKTYEKASEPASWFEFFGIEESQRKNYDFSHLPSIRKVRTYYYSARGISKDFADVRKAHGRVYSYLIRNGEFQFGGLQTLCKEFRGGLTTFNVMIAGKSCTFHLYQEVDIANCFPNIIKKVFVESPSVKILEGLKAEEREVFCKYIKDRGAFVDQFQKHYFKLPHSGKKGKKESFHPLVNKEKAIPAPLDPAEEESLDLSGSLDSLDVEETNHCNLLGSNSSFSFSDGSASVYSSEPSDTIVWHLEVVQEIATSDSSAGKNFFLSIIQGGNASGANYNHGSVLKVCNGCVDCKNELSARRRKDVKARPAGNYDCENAWAFAREVGNLVKAVDYIKTSLFESRSFPFELKSALRKAEEKKKKKKHVNLESAAKALKKRDKKWNLKKKEEKAKLIKKKMGEMIKREETRFWKNLKNSHFSYILASFERSFMNEIIEILTSKGLQVDVLIHDGLYVRNQNLILNDNMTLSQIDLNKLQPPLALALKPIDNSHFAFNSKFIDDNRTVFQEEMSYGALSFVNEKVFKYKDLHLKLGVKTFTENFNFGRIETEQKSSENNLTCNIIKSENPNDNNLLVFDFEDKLKKKNLAENMVVKDSMEIPNNLILCYLEKLEQKLTIFELEKTQMKEEINKLKEKERVSSEKMIQMREILMNVEIENHQIKEENHQIKEKMYDLQKEVSLLKKRQNDTSFEKEEKHEVCKKLKRT